jgi:hypothetical protein
MIILAICVAGLALVVYSFTRVNEEGEIVDPGTNYHLAYYGKNHYRPPISPPCDDCRSRGCIGAGACLCPCHKKADKS